MAASFKSHSLQEGQRAEMCVAFFKQFSMEEDSEPQARLPCCKIQLCQLDHLENLAGPSGHMLVWV